MLKAKEKGVEELYELDIDVSWLTLIRQDYELTRIEDIKIVPVVYNKDGTKFKDLRTNKIYKTGLNSQDNPKIAVMQRMCSMVEYNTGDKDLMWDYFNIYDLNSYHLIKERFTKCHGQGSCKYNFSFSPEKLVDHAKIQDKPGAFIASNGKITLNAVEELLFNREELVELADSIEKQYKSQERKVKAKHDVLNF